MNPFCLKAIAERLCDRRQWWQWRQVSSIAICKLLHGMKLLRFFLFLAHSIDDASYNFKRLLIPDSVVDVAPLFLFIF